MNNFTRMLGIEFPLVAFSHCRDVVVAVSRAGGLGVLGAIKYTPAELELELKWIDEHIGGKPYGVDLLVPEHQLFSGSVTLEEMAERVPQRHRDFIVDLLAKHGISVDSSDLFQDRLPYSSPEVGEALMTVAFRHPIRLIANALGIVPPAMIKAARAQGVPVAALIGAKEHALRQVDAGVDILVAQGTEAGGHCGEVSTLVLVPEVLKAVRQVSDVPVLAAGGIMTGRQMAACMAMGAAGAWCGTVWLASAEAETSEAIRQKIIKATSRSTVRSKFRTGKPSRQLRSAWHDAWEKDGSPEALPMPLMAMVTGPVFKRIEKAAEGGNPMAYDLVSYWVGQGVGLVDCVRSAGDIVQDFKIEFADAIGELMDIVGHETKRTVPNVDAATS